MLGEGSHIMNLRLKGSHDVTIVECRQESKDKNVCFIGVNWSKLYLFSDKHSTFKDAIYQTTY